MEEYNLLRSPAGTAYGDYAFRLCLTRDGFKAIPKTLISGDRQMIVMVEGRRPRCWSRKQIGHISKFCPEKPENAAAAAAAAAATTTTASTATTTTRKTAEAQDPSQGQPKTNEQEGWSEVTRKRMGSPKQGEKVQSHPLLKNKPRLQHQQQQQQNNQQRQPQLQQLKKYHRPQQQQRQQQHQWHQYPQYHPHW